MQEEQERRSIPEYLKKNGGDKNHGNIENQGKNKSKKQLMIQNQRIDEDFVGGYQQYAKEKEDLQNSINNIKEGSRIIKIKRRPTRRLDTCIAMYMPASVQCITMVQKYQDTELVHLQVHW